MLIECQYQSRLQTTSNQIRDIDPPHKHRIMKLVVVAGYCPVVMKMILEFHKIAGGLSILGCMGTQQVQCIA